ncbi:MAG: DUF3783 domain-containing protein [Thomasclavelia sp.]|nr:DUF3783 domain-containing protein [Thomasclavelia sp.]
MKKTVLYYQIGNESKELFELLDELHISYIEVNKSNSAQTLGSLLKLPGFKYEFKPSLVQDDTPMLVLNGFEEKEIDVLLGFIRKLNILPIPLKAMVTSSNINWSFEYLHEHVLEEHNQMRRLNK